MNETPTLPGTLPGLLQPGCPVIWLDCDGDHDQTGIHAPCAGWLVDRPHGWGESTDYAHVVLSRDHEVSGIPLSRLALDLSRPEGVDRALRWLAGRLGLPVGPLPPVLDRYVEVDDATWYLEASGYERDLRHGYMTSPIEALRLACLAVGEVSGG